MKKRFLCIAIVAYLIYGGSSVANAVNLPVTNPVTNPVANPVADPAIGISKNVGVLRGRIVDADNQVLPGANIYIESIQSGTISDINGFYSLINLTPGKYKIRVSYVGYATKELEVDVKPGASQELNITIDNGVNLKEVVVGGAFQGQQRAINTQKNNMSITNVVSADQVGKFPDSNIGDALKRINGINVQYDQGEARFGQVRGTSADLSSVTINGNRLPSAEGDTRNVQLDLIPADMVQTIEVNKVVTSDMDGDAIGGSINLVTKNTPYKRVINATAGTGYNWVSGKPQLNLGFTYGDRFFKDKLGIMLSASYQYAPSGSDNTEFEYEEKDGGIKLNQAQVRQYYVTCERQSYSAAFDFKFNPDHRISFKGMYNRRNDWENRYRVSYKKLDSSASKQSVVIQTKGGAGNTKNARLERQQTLDLTLDGEHGFGALSMNWAAGFARATEDRPNERYFGLKLSGEDYGSEFIDVYGRQPYTSKPIPSFSSANWKIDELTNQNQNIYENEWKFRLNLELPIVEGLYGNRIKVGGKFTTKTKDRDIHCFDYIDDYKAKYGDEWMNNTSTQVRSGFMPGSQYPIGTSFVDKNYLGDIDFSSLNGTEVLEKASGNYHGLEKIGSAYFRFDQRIGKKVDMVVGLRMEHTDLKYNGFNWEIDATGNEYLQATGDYKYNYTNWLPSVLVKYSVNNDFLLRASFTETLSRPKYSALIPCVNYSVKDETATIGNPNLKATTSFNYDLSAEYYFNTVGLVSVGVFYKNVKNMIVDEVWRGESQEIPVTVGQQFLITKPINAYDANLLGVELAYQRDFSFIAPAWKCVGFYGTYTYTHSDTKNLKFQHRTLADGEKVRMSGSPEHAANASLFFEKFGVNVRLSYNFASSFIDAMGTVADLDRYYDKVNYLDLNASYTWGKRFKYTVYAEANNLLNQALRYYQGEKDRTMQVEYYGMKLNAGIKINF